MGIEQERDIDRLVSMIKPHFKVQTGQPQSDAVDDIAAGVMYRISAHIEALCKQAQDLGPAVRVAISEPVYHQNKAMSWQLTVEHQFLEPDAQPSMPGVCRVYGPFPSVDSTDQP